MSGFTNASLRALVSGSLATTLFTAALNFGTGIALARWCGPQALGDFVIVAAWAHLAFALLSPGFDQAYIRSPDQRGRWDAVVLLSLIQVVLLLVLPLLVWLAVAPPQPAWVFEGVMVSIALSVLGNLALAPAAARLDYGPIHRARMVAAIAACGASLATAAVQSRPSLHPLVVRELVAGAALLLAALLCARRPAWTVRADRGQVTETVRFARGLWSLNALEKGVQRTEYILLGAVAAPSAVGVYYAIRSVFDGLYGVLATPIQTVFYAFLCRRNETNRAAPPALARAAIWRLAALAAVAALAAAAATPGLVLLFGEAFAAPPSLPAAFAWLLVAALAFEWIKVSAMAAGLHQRLARARWLQLAVLLVGIGTLGSVWGVSGAALAAAVGATILVATAWWVAGE